VGLAGHTGGLQISRQGERVGVQEGRNGEEVSKASNDLHECQLSALSLKVCRCKKGMPSFLH